jgi:serine/threonine protein kinase
MKKFSTGLFLLFFIFFLQPSHISHAQCRGALPAPSSQISADILEPLGKILPDTLSCADIPALWSGMQKAKALGIPTKGCLSMPLALGDASYTIYCHPDARCYFDSGLLIGQGAYKKVFYAIEFDQANSREFRKAAMLKPKDHEAKKRLMTEYAMATDLRNKKIDTSGLALIKDVCVESTDTSLASRAFMAHYQGNVADQIRKGNLFPDKNWDKQAKRILNALNNLHKLYLHRDIKPANILINDDGDVDIADFDAIKDVNASYLEVIAGTAGYSPPEILSSTVVTKTSDKKQLKERGKKSDIFAAGLTLYEMLKGSPHPLFTQMKYWFDQLFYPSYTPEEIKELMEITEWRFNKSKEELSKLPGDDNKRMQIILKMINPKVDERISSDEALLLFK